MKKIILITFMILILSASMVLAGTVTRSFSPSTAVQGGSVDVTLTIGDVGSATFYYIDEIYPAGWVVTVPGGGSTTDVGYLKWVIISGVADASYTYTLAVPAEAISPAAFSGEYRFEGEAASTSIGGLDQLTVSGASTCDGVLLEAGEECDGGIGCTDCVCDTDYQSTTPVSVDCEVISYVCGNGEIDETDEECDDGNNANGDGCSGTCMIEPGNTCTGEPSVCTSIGASRAVFLEQMGTVYDDAEEEGSWTLTLITRIANLLKGLFP